VRTLEQVLAVETADIYVNLRLDPVANVPRANTVPELLIGRGLHAEPNEAVYVVATDPEQVRIVACVAIGDPHSVTVHIPTLLSIPILSGADHVTIAHNHPSGRLLPSKFDYNLTAEVVEAFNLVGITVDDHIIMGPSGKYLSMKDAHVLEAPKPRKLELKA
jgi:DNA repair protein RadC